MRWRLYIEEYHPTFHYVKGETNTLADALSRLPCAAGQTSDSPGENLETSVDDTSDSLEFPSDSSFAATMSVDLQQCMLAFPEIIDFSKRFPVDYVGLAEQQAADAQLQQKHVDDPTTYPRTAMDDRTHLICYRRHKDSATEDRLRICIPDRALDSLIQWYHDVLAHTGATRVYQTIAKHFYHPKLHARTDTIIGSCDACQRFKLPGKGYGKLPPR